MEIKVNALENVTSAAKEFLQKVIFPPLEEIGLLFSDQVKLWRFRNQINILNKAEKYLKTKEINTRKVSLKMLVPLLEESSLEEDESLQEKWVALIANTVAEKSSINTTLFCHILSQLTKADAELFQIIFEHCTSKISIEGKQKYVIDMQALYASAMKEYHEDYETILDNLIRLRLLKDVGKDVVIVTVTSLAVKFMSACEIN